MSQVPYASAVCYGLR